MRSRPTIKVPIRLGIPEEIVRQAKHHPICNHPAVFVTGNAVAASTGLQFCEVFGEKQVKKTLRIRPLEL